MIVKELIALLQQENEDAEVLVRFPASFEPVLYVGRNLVSHGDPSDLVLLYRSGYIHELEAYP